MRSSRELQSTEKCARPEQLEINRRPWTDPPHTTKKKKIVISAQKITFFSCVISKSIIPAGILEEPYRSGQLSPISLGTRMKAIRLFLTSNFPQDEPSRVGRKSLIDLIRKKIDGSSIETPDFVNFVTIT